MSSLKERRRMKQLEMSGSKAPVGGKTDAEATKMKAYTLHVDQQTATSSKKDVKLWVQKVDTPPGQVPTWPNKVGMVAVNYPANMLANEVDNGEFDYQMISVTLASNRPIRPGQVVTLWNPIAKSVKKYGGLEIVFDNHTVEDSPDEAVLAMMNSLPPREMENSLIAMLSNDRNLLLARKSNITAPLWEGVTSDMPIEQKTAKVELDEFNAMTRKTYPSQGGATSLFLNNVPDGKKAWSSFAERMKGMMVDTGKKKANGSPVMDYDLSQFNVQDFSTLNPMYIAAQLVPFDDDKPVNMDYTNVDIKVVLMVDDPIVKTSASGNRYLRAQPVVFMAMDNKVDPELNDAILPDQVLTVKNMGPTFGVAGADVTEAMLSHIRCFEGTAYIPAGNRPEATVYASDRELGITRKFEGDWNTHFVMDMNKFLVKVGTEVELAWAIRVAAKKARFNSLSKGNRIHPEVLDKAWFTNLDSFQQSLESVKKSIASLEVLYGMKFVPKAYVIAADSAQTAELKSGGGGEKVMAMSYAELDSIFFFVVAEITNEKMAVKAAPVVDDDEPLFEVPEITNGKVTDAPVPDADDEPLFDVPKVTNGQVAEGAGPSDEPAAAEPTEAKPATASTKRKDATKPATAAAKRSKSGGDM